MKYLNLRTGHGPDPCHEQDNEVFKQKKMLFLTGQDSCNIFKAKIMK